jgi:IS605 OrfB family transposase
LLEIVYKVEPQEQTRADNILSIDIGLDNLLTCFDIDSNRTFIISGRTIKAINYYWNKRNASLQSIKDKQQISFQTRQQFLIARNRHNRIQDYLKKASHYIVSYCIANHIGKVVVGHNPGWKQKCNLGKRNNQNFVQVPFHHLLRYIVMKCQVFGILYQEINEAHTSKCSFLDMEAIEHHEEYLGKRIHRGLFQTATGIWLNADVNATGNIYRKVSGDYSFLSGDRVRGFVANPVRITLV